MGEFLWKRKRYAGVHEPLISRELWERTQAVLDEANRPRYGKHRFRYTGLLQCGSCGCAITAELRKAKYVYYHCTGHRGRRGSRYLREEMLTELLGEVVGRVHVTEEQATFIADALRSSQADKQRDHRRATLIVQQRYQRVQEMLDRAYDDRLAGRISEALWERRSREWEAELASTRSELERLERASHEYTVVGSQILELAKNAKTLFLRQSGPEQARLLKTLLSNCTLRDGSLTPTYKKPFDLLVEGNETEDWLGGRDSNPDNVVQSHVSYR